ncbi:MAG: glycine oxidase ThiO [Candidatus Dormiibacterota bacterium]
MSSQEPPECLVVGAGVVGLSVALSLARGGARVRILERERKCGQAASAAAAGMLAEGAEVNAEGPFQNLCRQSSALWPNWAAELLAETGVDCELERSGLLRVTGSEEVSRRLASGRDWQLSHGVEVSELLNLAELRQVVPGLGGSVVAGLRYPGDWHVHSHRVVDALVAACRVRGVEIETDTKATGLEPGPVRPRLRLHSGGEIEADYVVICAGSWSGGILSDALKKECPVEPVRGQIVALDPGRPVLPLIVFGDDGYLLQKRSGLVLVGTTEEQVGYQAWPTAEGVELLTGIARQLLPALADARFAYAWAGLRPHVADGLPLLGRLEPGGRVLVATAHYRNGVLLAPITGELIAQAVREGEDPPALAAFSPQRLA